VQFEHIDWFTLPAGEYRAVTGQPVHDATPVDFEYVPGGQGVQAVAPGPLYRPTGHDWGVAVLVVGHAVPAGHDVHAVAPAAGPLKVPAVHGMHVAKPVPPELYLPEVHSI
jgi:hypothetical protein